MKIQRTAKPAMATGETLLPDLALEDPRVSMNQVLACFSRQAPRDTVQAYPPRYFGKTSFRRDGKFILGPGDATGKLRGNWQVSFPLITAVGKKSALPLNSGTPASWTISPIVGKSQHPHRLEIISSPVFDSLASIPEL